MLLDSNIIIYAAQPEHAALRQFIETHAPAVSVSSYIEVGGTKKEDDLMRRLLALTAFITLSVATPLAAQNVVYTVIDLGTLGGTAGGSQAYGINASGHATRFSSVEELVAFITRVLSEECE